MQLQKRSAWKTILKLIEKNITKEQYNTWFSNINITTFTDKNIKILVPNLFVKECLLSNYTEILQESILEVCKINPKITILCDNKKSTKLTKRDFYKTTTSNLNKNYTFDNFVVGSSNKLAHAATKSIIESPGYMYNPLFLYGPTGLGKTHLLQSIYINICANNYNENILYLTCDDLINRYVNNLEKGDLDTFRKKCKEVDILLIDDIQFLSKSDMLKEEFFHIFNNLYNSQKQIVLTSDRKPEKIPELPDRLISRFNWGLKCKLEPPDIETSLAIIEKKSSLLGISLPLDVKQIIAKNITSNVREIEGAILKVKENAKNNKCKVNLDQAKNTLYEYLNENNDLSIEKILKVISIQFNLNIPKLLSKNRSKSISLPRQIAMYLTRKLTPLSFNEIGCYFGGRDHTTVMYAYEKIKKSNNENSTTKSLLKSLENKLQRY